jgi:hypothetical protein
MRPINKRKLKKMSNIILKYISDTATYHRQLNIYLIFFIFFYFEQIACAILTSGSPKATSREMRDIPSTLLSQKDLT